MTMNNFDDQGRFILRDFSSARPFSSFLPGIAGPEGIPLWVFYVNRGQAVAAFGIQSKDHPILEFQPANKAYQLTPWCGFRTFIKILPGASRPVYEPFSPSPQSAGVRRQMAVGMNELELQEVDPGSGLQTDVLYFTVPKEDFAGLVRRVAIKNISSRPVSLEILDGLPAVIPYPVSNAALKNIGRTIEAWMEVYNVENRAPFFRLRSSAGDSPVVEEIERGNFAFAFLESGGNPSRLPAVVDPECVFGRNTGLSRPDCLERASLSALLEKRQITLGRTPCAFFAAAVALEPGESAVLFEVFGHLGSIEKLEPARERLTVPGYLMQRRAEGNALVRKLTDGMETKTADPVFDAYCRQTLLDNILRGGWPLVWGDPRRPAVFHLYSRKHGDLERDYNDFLLMDEPYSQGNGNYRDIIQNRRCDVLLNPRVVDFNIRTFLSLIQADGYNPLVILGSTFTIPPARRAEVGELADPSQALENFLSQPFTPGTLLGFLTDQKVSLRIPWEEFLNRVMSAADQHVNAVHGEGFWVDHWTYNLDLVESFLEIYPERKARLLFEGAEIRFYDNPFTVQPREKKFVLSNGRPRQLNAIKEDPEKVALLASRSEPRQWLRTGGGRGEIFHATVFAKLVSLAINKFATLDPWGMGIEMEAGRPGWDDALNGLPGMFGSSMPETYELKRLVDFLRQALRERGEGELELPAEMGAFLKEIIRRLEAQRSSRDPDRDYLYWDTVASARETYRASIRLGLGGAMETIHFSEMAKHLADFSEKLGAGIARALSLNDDLPPTFFVYRVEEFEPLLGADGKASLDGEGRPIIRPKRFTPVVLPLFLEGPVHAMKLQENSRDALKLYQRIKEGELHDKKLKMYRLNASLESQGVEIGRARVFPPGWLENESVWLHMEYKYLLEVLRAGLYEEFFSDARTALIPFLDPAAYGRSPLENSSFLVSSAHPDDSLHGAGFVARLSGSTAEFLSMWNRMMAGAHPFTVEKERLQLAFRPALPGWLFTDDGKITFTFLGQCQVTYHNPRRLDTYHEGMRIQKNKLLNAAGEWIELSGDVIAAPYAESVREGKIREIELYFAS